MSIEPFQTGEMDGWQLDGNCRDADPNLFYPGRGDDLKAPKAICAKCTVKAECLKFALENGEKFGVWGGMSERGRRRLRRERQKHGTPQGFLTHLLARETPCEQCQEADDRRKERLSGTSSGRLICLQCAALFDRRTTRGPIPLYCSDPCREASKWARRKAMAS